MKDRKEKGSPVVKVLLVRFEIEKVCGGSKSFRGVFSGNDSLVVGLGEVLE
jgi:hypothetical protein